ncbi:MAG TPA: DUF4112 domain-containing protein [Polyangia bacterium]|jgi:hypothetical protein|nr:DUF4112 domain-containing protein [Polyangia bacterium]
MDAPDRPQRPEEDHALMAAEKLAHWLDDRFLDPLLGLLLPGLGDLLGSALGLYPVLLAWQRRAPKGLLARMLLNLAVDAAGGSIPILGDLWDFVFKAHARNLALLRSRTGGAAIRGHWSDNLVVALAIVALLAAFAVPILVAIGIWRLVARALGK